jgi:hypothetical protein
MNVATPTETSAVNPDEKMAFLPFFRHCFAEILLLQNLGLNASFFSFKMLSNTVFLCKFDEVFFLGHTLFKAIGFTISTW